MAEVNFGSTLNYGVGAGTVSGAELQTWTWTEEFKDRAEGRNADGEIVTLRYDNAEKQGQLTMLTRTTGFTIKTAGQSITSIDGATWIVESVEEVEENQGFTRVTYNVRKPQYITVT